MRTLTLAIAFLLCGLFIHAQQQTILPENILFTVENEVSMNSKDSEFGVNEWMGKFCFTTNRNHFDRKNRYLGEAAYNVMTFDDKRNNRKIYPFAAIKSMNNVGSVSQVADNKFYFTAESKKAEYNLKAATKTNAMIIYEAEARNGQWKINPLRMVKDKKYSFIHPTISKSGRTMFFASDIPGGYGGMDIYVSHLENGKWSEPQNLGPHVNTCDDELFPFIHPSGMLFFSSNGHRGFGGMDIFVSLKINNEWVMPENMGSPVNTNADDFSMYINQDFSEGYFSSNREGGMGSDDIYYLGIGEMVSENSLDINENVVATTFE